MAQPQITGIRTRFLIGMDGDEEARELIEAMQVYVVAAGEFGGKRNDKLLSTQSKVIEQKLSVFYKGVTTKKDVFGIPDITIPSIEADRLAAALGIDDAGELEVKSKRTARKSSAFKASKILEFTPSDVGTEYKGSRVGAGLSKKIQDKALELDYFGGGATEETVVGQKAYGQGTKFDITNPSHVLRAARKALGGAPKFLQFFKDRDRPLWEAFYNKAKNLVINKAVLDGGETKVVKVDSLNIHFPKNQFKHPPFTFEIHGPKKLELALNTAFEKKLIQDLLSTDAAILASNTDQFQRGLDKVVTKNTSVQKSYTFGKGTPLEEVISYKIRVGGSIPMAILGIKKGVSKDKRKKQAPQKFISGAQITALVQKRLAQIMPQGPRRGPPLSPTILTQRTGRFRRSVSVVPRYRENVMRYMYDPLYMSLVNTPRNPDILISSTIRDVVQGLFGRQFAILRGM